MFKNSQPSHLTLSDILKATNNFDKSLLIGREVYRCEVSPNGETLVVAAIKRMKPDSMGKTPLELEALSTFRHSNLASLIGYCNYVKVNEVKKKSLWKNVFNNLASLLGFCNCVREVEKQSTWESVSTCDEEIILVYEYVPNGTLKDHLHVFRTPLSLITRLNICIDVARALHYLHTRTETKTDTTLMHGDLKSSNILLTESWRAKVSDFGLAKICPFQPLHWAHVFMFPHGTFGYHDAFSIAMTGRLTKKSDVYSFGVVLLEVLCRKPAADESRYDNQRTLVMWVQVYLKEGNLEDIIDPEIKNEVSSKSLKDLFEIAERCLREHPKERPDMAEVVSSLESVLRDPSNFKGDTNFPKVLADSQSPRASVKEITFDDLKKATRGFSKPLISDEQGSGDVFLGWVEQNTLAPSKEGVGLAVAVKQIPQSYNEWMEEVNFLGQLNHPNIIRLLGFCNRDEHERLVVYEHMNKSLSKFIHGDEPFPWKKRLEVMIRVARGLEYLCKNVGVICYFHSSDVLLNEKFEAKIGRFGWMEVQERPDRKQLNGTFGYLKAKDHGYLLIKNDVYSFGLVLLETLTGKHSSDFEEVFMGLQSLEMESPERKLNRRKLSEIMDPRLKDGYSVGEAFKCLTLASRCIAIQPEYRPSRAEILWSLERICPLNKL